MGVGNPGRRIGPIAAGLTILALTLLLIVVAALLSVAAPADSSWLNGTYVSVEVLAIVAVALLLAAFAVGVLVYGEAYLATLWATAPFVPAVASAAVLVSYLTLPPAPGGLSHGLGSVCVGSAAAAAVWLVGGVPLRSLANVATAQTYSYLWLCQRTRRLATMIAGLGQPGRPEDIAAIAEARGYLGRLQEELGIAAEPGSTPATTPASGLRYVSATGYLDLWRLVYRAEEILLELDDSYAVDAAVYDALRLDSSTLVNHDSLRAKLKAAIGVLNPAAAGYLETPLSAEGQQAEKAQTEAQQVARAIQPPATPEEARRAAHSVIRIVREAIDEMRDAQWVGIVRARNRLLRTSLFTGLFGFAIQAMAEISAVTVTLLVGAATFYLVGSLVGLIARLRSEAQSNSAQDDYGLFEARLIQTPLLSGLAAVAGVFLVAVGTPLLTPGNSAVPLTNLQDVFDLSKNMIGLLAAAVFGLTPELVLKELQAYGDNRLKDLESSQATTTATTPGAATQ